MDRYKENGLVEINGDVRIKFNRDTEEFEVIFGYLECGCKYTLVGWKDLEKAVSLNIEGEQCICPDCGSDMKLTMFDNSITEEIKKDMAYARYERELQGQKAIMINNIDDNVIIQIRKGGLEL